MKDMRYFNLRKEENHMKIIIIVAVIFIIYKVIYKLTTRTYTESDANGNKYKIKKTLWETERSPDDSWMSLSKSLDRHENLKDITDLDSYYKALREYYSEYGNGMLRLEVIMRLLHAYHLDKVLNKSADDIQKDLKIIANGEELPGEKLPIYKTKRWEELKSKRVYNNSVGDFYDIFGDIFGDYCNSSNIIYDAKSYLNTLERYYLEFSNYMFDKDVINEFIRIYQLDTKFQIGYGDVIRDLHKIVDDYSKRNKTVQHQNSNHTLPTQAQNKQTQTTSNTPPVHTQPILDEQKLLNYIKAMPVKWEYGNPDALNNEALRTLCSSLLNSKEVSAYLCPDYFKQMEYAIQKKRERTPRKADYNSVMETNILYELYEYSYLMSTFKVLEDRKDDTVKVNGTMFWKLVQEDCHKRLQNLEQEKRNNPAIRSMFQKYEYDTSKIKMIVNDYVEPREYDYIYVSSMTGTLLATVLGLVLSGEVNTGNGYRPTLEVIRQYSANEMTAALGTAISSFVNFSLGTYANGGRLPRKPQ